MLGLGEQGLERIGVGGVAGLRALGLRHVELLEEHDLQLLRRAEVHLLADDVVRLLRGSEHPFGELGVERVEVVGVDGDAVGLHAEQDVDERQLDVAQQRQRRLRLQLLLQDSPQLECRMGALHGDLRATVVVEGQLAGVVVGGHELTVQVADRQVGEVVGALVGLDQVGGQRGVGRDAGQRPSLGRKRMRLALGVVQHLGPGGIGQPVGEDLLVVGRELLDRDPRRRAGGRGQGEVLGTRTDRTRDADDLQTHRAGLGVLGQPRGKFSRRDMRDGEVGRGVRGGRLVAAPEVVEQPLAEGGELQGVEHLVDGVAVPLRGERQVGGAGGQVEVVDERVDAAVAQHVVEVLSQRLPRLARNGIDVGHQGVEGAVGVDPFRGGLRARRRARPAGCRWSRPPGRRCRDSGRA